MGYAHRTRTRILSRTKTMYGTTFIRTGIKHSGTAKNHGFLTASHFWRKIIKSFLRNRLSRISKRIGLIMWYRTRRLHLPFVLHCPISNWQLLRKRSISTASERTEGDALHGDVSEGRVTDMHASRIKSLYEHIASLAEKSQLRPALLSCDQEGKVLREINFKELVKEIKSAAVYLSRLGLRKGGRVALAFKNSAELLTISWAAWSVGIITVPLDTKRDTGEQHAYKIKLNNAKVLIAQQGALRDEDRTHLGGVNIVEFAWFPKGSRAKIDWEEGLSHQALVLFTSGTTAHPKGAKLSLQNLIVNAESIREWLRITEDDRFLVNLPLHHINSTTFCLSVLLAGGSIAIPPTYSNSHFWSQMANTGATITSIVQSILFDQLNREEEYASVRKNIKLNKIQIGSAPVIASTVQEFRKKFGIPLFQGYGQTETALRVTGVPMGLSEELYERLVEENSIGAPMEWADVRVADENGKFLGEGEGGELGVKGGAK